MRSKFTIMLMFLLMAAIITGCEEVELKGDLNKFQSEADLEKAFEEAKDRGGWFGGMFEAKTMAVGASEAAPQADSGRDYSETNIQVEGVDEADIIKTDGDYIYAIAQGNLVIVKAHPNSEILSTNTLDEFGPQELFIHKDRLLMFGYTNYKFQEGSIVRESAIGKPMAEIMPHPAYRSMMTARLYDVSDKEEPELLKTVDLEGNYLTSRKIGSDVYFVVNSYPRYGDDGIIPLYRENGGFEKIAEADEIGYVEPIQAENFIMVAAISMTNEDEELNKEVIVGSGQNVYASLENLFVAQTSWPRYNVLREVKKDYTEKTVITKFRLHNGKIDFLSKGEVKGHILNQFSMDEHDRYFRIATTAGNLWDRDKLSSNNVYVLDRDLEVVGELEDLAPGEKIYSVRFMGERGYVVTFKKVDPLFVIDLENPSNPSVLGKLKIPGYSDYLHPYDENHIIGIGKDAVDASEGLIQRRNLDFAWYQGVKMAIFDVSDVENPKELHKVIIGDRGTDSPALHNHKAFLFDLERNLLVLPITLAEIKGEKTSDNQYGEFVFQGAYVYDIDLDDGFDLRGRVTHNDDDEVYKKSGHYIGRTAAIKRSLYIDDVLYTLSDERLQLNDLDDLERLKVLEFEEGNYVIY